MEEQVRWQRPRIAGGGQVKETGLVTMCKLGVGGCQAGLSQANTPSLGLSPLMAFGLNFSTPRAVLGAVFQFTSVLWSSGIGSLLVPDCFFLLHSFLHSTFIDHALCVVLWAKPWGYREENHSHSFSILSLHNSFICPSKMGRPG